MASTDARPVPIKNAAFRAVFPLLDADGDLVTGATGLDSEVSKDQGTFADCTNEATEIATSSGMYYLDLTSTEMNADCVAVIVKTSSSGAKTTVLVFYPEEAGDINVDVTAWNGTAIPGVDTAGYPKVTIKDGTGTGEIDTTSGGVLVAAIAANAITATAINADAITAAKIADGAIDAATFAAGAINAAAIADGAIDRATFAADTGLQTIRSNTAQAGAAGSITLDASASATTDFYKGSWIFLTGGTGVGQVRLCTAYNGGTKVATIAPNWATNPDATSTFAVLPAAGVDLELIANAAVSTSTAQLGVNVVQAGGTAWGSGAITAAAIASNAITSAKIASGAITSTGIAASAIGASQLASGAITNAKFAAGAIDAAAIAADAIGASELAADAVAEIADAIWDEATSGHVTAGSYGLAASDILADTADMQPKLGTPADTDLATDIANLSAEHTLQNGTLAEISAALGNDTIQTATIGTTGNDTTHLHVPDFTYGDDEINDYLMVVRDASTGNRYARWVADWVNSTKLATVATIPFTPENSTDQVILLAIRRDSGLTAAETRAAVGLASANLDTQLTAIDDYIDTEVAAIKAKTDLIPASPAATSDIPSAATIADAVWDEALSGHTTAGSGGKSLSDIDTHTDTEVASILAAVDTEVAAIKAKTDQLTFTTANQVDATTMSMAANALTAAATASDFGTEVATAVWASATRTLSALGFTLSASDLAADTIGASELAADAVTEIVNAVLTTAMTESYNADGAAPTLAQAMFLCMQRLTEFAISGTAVVVKKLDGSTTAYTLTLDDAVSPTSTTRSG